MGFLEFLRSFKQSSACLLWPRRITVTAITIFTGGNHSVMQGAFIPCVFVSSGMVVKRVVSFSVGVEDTSFSLNTEEMTAWHLVHPFFWLIKHCQIDVTSNSRRHILCLILQDSNCTRGDGS